MGYEIQETTYRLKLEELGAEVVVREPSIGATGAAAALAEVDFDAVRDGRIAPGDVGRIMSLLDAFAGCLASWDLTREGQPVPATVEGVRSLPLPLALAIISAWMDTINAHVEAARVDEVDLPMDALPA